MELLLLLTFFLFLAYVMTTTHIKWRIVKNGDEFEPQKWKLWYPKWVGYPNPLNRPAPGCWDPSMDIIPITFKTLEEAKSFIEKDQKPKDPKNKDVVWESKDSKK